MAFIQIIDHTTSRPDEIQALGEKFQADRPADGGFVRSTITKDRDRENHYLVIVEFTSYEEAMKNSEDPRTQEFAARLTELSDAPPVFYNLDVVATLDA